MSTGEIPRVVPTAAHEELFKASSEIFPLRYDVSEQLIIALLLGILMNARMDGLHAGTKATEHMLRNQLWLHWATHFLSFLLQLICHTQPCRSSPMCRITKHKHGVQQNAQ